MPASNDEFALFAEACFSRAIARTLQAPPAQRAALFEQLTAELTAETLRHDPTHKPWTCSVHDGTDGSRVFRGALGLSLVIDSDGRVWRGRNVEDFSTTWTITANSAEIETLTPDYGRMREYLPR